MPANKNRLEINLDEETAEFLRVLAKRDGVSQATKAVEILEKKVMSMMIK